LKLLQSEGADHRIDRQRPGDGRLLTHQYRVEGPVMIFLTTTAIDIDEELLNRCLVLTVNEDREQTQAIHRCSARRRRSKAAAAAGPRCELLRLHRNAQRLLKPVFVVNPLRAGADVPRRPDPDAARPYEVPDAHPLHRPAASASAAPEDGRASGKPVEYIEVTLDDIAVANRSRMRCWAVRSTSCRRRRGGCCCWSTRW
jgi:hypothetical protein